MANKKKSINLDQFFSSAQGSAGDDLTFLLGAAPEETAQVAAERGLPLVYLPTQAIEPDPDQLRHLPRPQELRTLAAKGDRAAKAALSGLEDLGRSMRDYGQIQPIIVYPATDPRRTAVTHRILNGQRRWSAALLLDLPTLWAIEVPQPNDLNRLLQQFEENERREGFTDMERAWALMALKDALHKQAQADVPWGVVEQQLQLSTQRRQDLLRLLRFPEAGQSTIMRYGWSEWTLRPLHMALNAGTLSADEAGDMLQALSESAEVNLTTVSTLVERYIKQRASTPGSTVRETGMPAVDGPERYNAEAPTKLARMRRNLEQLRAQAGPLDDPAVRRSWRTELEHLRATLDTMLADLQ